MGAGPTTQHPLGPMSLGSLRFFNDFPKERETEISYQKFSSFPFKSKLEPTSPFHAIASWPFLVIMQARLELSSFPAEVILGVFCSLSAFPDILHLAATCQKHRQIFHDNVSTIYHYVSPMVITCRRYARKLLADQGGALPNEIPTVQDFLQMTRNSIVMEKSVVHFNETVVIKMTHRRRARMLSPT